MCQSGQISARWSHRQVGRQIWTAEGFFQPSNPTSSQHEDSAWAPGRSCAPACPCSPSTPGRPPAPSDPAVASCWWAAALRPQPRHLPGSRAPEPVFFRAYSATAFLCSRLPAALSPQQIMLTKLILYKGTKESTCDWYTILVNKTHTMVVLVGGKKSSTFCQSQVH